MAYQIITDTCCDFPQQMYEELNITAVPLCVRFRDAEHTQYTEAWLKDMYDGLRAGEFASTAAANPQDWASVIAPVLEQGEDALVLAFSSGLSTTYQSAVIAAAELSEQFPERKIQVVDTLCASMGQGLLVWYACQKRDAGLSLEELTQWCEENKKNLCHWFTVDDLMYLKRGGRVSTATAIIGTMLQIKPLLHVDDEGHLISVSKTRGRKASIQALAAKVGELGTGWENETFFISHGDCLEDAEYLASILKEQYSAKQVIISYVGGVIGSHSGPETLALFFLGDHR